MNTSTYVIRTITRYRQTLISLARQTITIKAVVAGLLITAVGSAEMTIPEGTKLRVRLESTITSATAEEGQTVELSVAEPIKLGDVTVIGEGARVTGTITEAHEKRRMGRAGKLDFSIDRVKTIDNSWLPLRYTVTKKSGQSHAVRTGIITAGVAFAFWPAAPVMLLMKGKDVTINKGISFDVYTDVNHPLSSGPTAQPAGLAAQNNLLQQPSDTAPSVSGMASVTITSTVLGADIEVDGSFIGNTPTIVQLTNGVHRVTIKANEKVWERTLQVNAGSSVSLNAALN